MEMTRGATKSRERTRFVPTLFPPRRVLMSSSGVIVAANAVAFRRLRLPERAG
jgi:hypothetical protein